MNMRRLPANLPPPLEGESDLSRLFCKEDSITKMVILSQDLGGGIQSLIVLTHVQQL